eukprot:CAMPEP_0177664718 /NCGR_PEP_ID=MMETSP0447-20121125/20656_1 /TAXON_ID=0 /ORGANISM="Stygamoeba regulata, Strain BSH-02190019" /LENGTH=672 /DNA_ID=CAMNT_0019170735 /DNA_START=125 /DNA_END=2143 /DNA_ORIENTATION=-
MADEDAQAARLKRMMENQKKREEAMKQKEMEKQAADQKAAEAAKPKNVPCAAAGAKESKPLENRHSQKVSLLAPLPFTERGKAVLLGGDPNGDNILYVNGLNVVVRSLRDTSVADMYSEHAYQPTVARYSPCRRYIASADQTGVVRVWHTDETVADTVHKLKFEKKVLSGPIADLAWDVESKRIVVAGNGREVFGTAFSMETGASLGQLTGHSKQITTCDLRPCKPYRVVSGSEDFTLCWYEGPPFKWKKGISGQHTRWVNCVRFNKQGALFASAGQDKKVLLFDGDSGTLKGEFQGGHGGGVYACSWNPEGTRLLTCSGDRTCKVWDAETTQCVSTFEFGKDVEAQQVGCLWQGEFLVSLGLDSRFSYLDVNSGKVCRTMGGHSKSVSNIAYHAASSTLYSASYDGIINRWGDDGVANVIAGTGHTNAVKGMAIQAGTGTLVTSGMDDTARFTPLGAGDYSGSSSAAVDSPATCAAAGPSGDASVVTTIKSVNLFHARQKVATVAVSWAPQTAAIANNGNEVLVGGEDNKIHVFAISGASLSETGTLEGHRGPLTCIAFSPCGKYFCSADRNRDIFVWDASTKKIVIKDWVYHSARVNRLAWRSDSKYIASAGLDQNMFIWSIDDPTNRIKFANAHQGGIDDITWVNNDEVITAGQDGSIRRWKIDFSKKE